MDATPSAFEAICRYHASGGTTGLLATTASAPLDEILACLTQVRQARLSDPIGARVLGAHVEGPYFALAKKGCHLASQVRHPQRVEMDRLFEHAEDIKSMTLAPELPGAHKLIAGLRERGCIPSLGHSDATFAEVLKAIELGARHVTHMFCAMSSIVRKGATRICGLVEATLLRDELTTEVIADGKHLPPELIQLTLRAKGLDRVCAVTDAMRGAGMPDGQYAFGPKHGELAIAKDGEAKTLDGSGFASSVVRTCDLVRVLTASIGLSLPEAVRAVSLTPARILGMADRKGSLEVGKDADLVAFDDRMNVKLTLVGGKTAYDG
jgi:N-acetylglucosamine-6-phosphate deacetylase